MQRLIVFMTKAVERSMAKTSKVREFDIQKRASIPLTAELLSHLHLEKLRQNISHNLNSFAYHKQQLIHIEETKKNRIKLSTQTISCLLLMVDLAGNIVAYGVYL